MGIFDFFKRTDINAKVKEFSETNDAVLLDVRTSEEYAQGHIPESINIPLQRIAQAKGQIADTDRPLFVYCYSGSRSAQAVSWLQKTGYTNVTNIGGIRTFRGTLETGGGK